MKRKKKRDVSYIITVSEMGCATLIVAVLMGIQLGLYAGLRNNGDNFYSALLDVVLFALLGGFLLILVLESVYPQQIPKKDIRKYTAGVSCSIVIYTLCFNLMFSLTSRYLAKADILFLAIEHLLVAIIATRLVVSLIKHRRWILKHFTKTSVQDIANCTTGDVAEDTVESSLEPQHDKAFVMLYDYDEAARVEKIIFCGKLVSAIGSKPALYAKLLDIRNVLEDKTHRLTTLQLDDAANGKLEIVSQHIGGVSYKPATAAREKIIRMLRREATMQKKSKNEQIDGQIPILNNENSQGGERNGTFQ